MGMKGYRSARAAAHPAYIFEAGWVTTSLHFNSARFSHTRPGHTGGSKIFNTYCILFGVFQLCTYRRFFLGVKSTVQYTGTGTQNGCQIYWRKQTDTLKKITLQKKSVDLRTINKKKYMCYIFLVENSFFLPTVILLNAGIGSVHSWIRIHSKRKIWIRIPKKQMFKAFCTTQD